MNNVVYTFPRGVPGFENIREFELLTPEEPSPFAYLRAVGESGVCFLVADPFAFFPDYEFELGDDAKAELDLAEGREGDVQVWAIVTVPENVRETTVNLLAPVVLNTRSRLGKQVILHDSRYAVKCPLFVPRGSAAEPIQTDAGERASERGR